MLEPLKEGRDLYRRRAWRDAYRTLLAAHRASPLDVDDLERLATSAYLIGREGDFQTFLDRAYHVHLETGDAERAARCAFWLGLTLFLRGEPGQAGGWLARSRRLVEGRDCVEHGYLMLPTAEQHLGAGDGEAARSSAVRAIEIGERFGDPDLIACARHLQGRAFIRTERIHDGLTLLDEAMLAATTGELSPIMTGLIYCSLIAICHEVHALRRAREWTSALARWCDEQPQMVAFTGVCLVHRAQILQFSGDWAHAMEEVDRARERFSEAGGREPPAAAYYQQAELHRLRGEYARAEEAYRKAGQLGQDPQPGLALLRLAQGRTDAACSAVRRVLETRREPLQRARLLPACVEIMLAAGDIEEAQDACHELAEIAQAFDTDVLVAMATQARGEVELAQHDPRAALGSLRRAFEAWRKVDAPYEAARVRTLMGLACRAVGDAEAAELELEAARAAFESLGATPDLKRIASLEGHGVSQRAHPLTPREIEVLRLISVGKTNRDIANELFLSERTIDRHVSNILTKLDVPSRAAATGYAYRRGLL